MNLSRRLNIISISSSKEIKKVINNSKKIYHKYGIIFLNRDDTVKERLRVAIIVKKSCGSAVKRNYIKRISKNLIIKNITLFAKFNRVIFLFLSKENFRYKELEKELITKFLL